MPDSIPPATIRVVRPYATEDELLEDELEMFTRTSITLLGAAPRPQGLVLRFELVLSSGAVVLRGEGRVVGFKPDAHFGTGGLTLRFTRLDSRSKLLVDRAAGLRDRRRPSAMPPATDASSPSLPPLRVDDDLPSRSRVLDAAEEVPLPSASAPELIPIDFAPISEPAAAPFPREPSVRPTASRDRDALLARLRARSQALDASTVQRLLDAVGARARG